MQQLCIYLLSLMVLGCSSNPSNTYSVPYNAPVQVTYPAKPLYINTNEGLGADIRLSFTEKLITDTSTIYRVNSVYN